MPHYRLYSMNRVSGHIERVDEFEAPDAVAAKRQAAQKLDGHPLELWEGPHKLGRFEPDATGAHVLRVWQQRDKVAPSPGEPSPHP